MDPIILGRFLASGLSVPLPEEGGGVSAQPDAADREAAIAAAHNTIFDNHNPVRCAEIIDLINSTAKVTAADCMALAAMLMATVLAHMPTGVRGTAVGGVAAMTGQMLKMHEAGEVVPAATADAAPA